MRRQLLALITSLLLTTPGIAGVVVKINGVEFKPGVAPPLTPPLGVTVAFSGTGALDTTITFPSQISTSVLIHIFDEATDDNLLPGQSGYVAPSVGIGKLSLIGSASAAGKISLLIADGDQVVFPTNLTEVEDLKVGLTTLGGTLNTSASSNGGLSHDYDANPWSSTNSTTSNPQFTDWGNASLRGIIIENPSLRRQTVLAAVVKDSVCPGYSSEVGSKGRGRGIESARPRAAGIVPLKARLCETSVRWRWRPPNHQKRLARPITSHSSQPPVAFPRIGGMLS